MLPEFLHSLVFVLLFLALPSSPVPVSDVSLPPRSSSQADRYFSNSDGPVRTYAAEAGGKFSRKLPHMNIGSVLPLALSLVPLLTVFNRYIQYHWSRRVSFSGFSSRFVLIANCHFLSQLCSVTERPLLPLLSPRFSPRLLETERLWTTT